MTRRELKKLSLDYAAGILQASLDGCEPPAGLSEQDEEKFWDEVRAVGNTLVARLARYK